MTDQVTTGQVRRPITFGMFGAITSLADAQVLSVSPSPHSVTVRFSRTLTDAERQAVLDTLASVDDADMADRAATRKLVAQLQAQQATPLTSTLAALVLRLAAHRLDVEN